MARRRVKHKSNTRNNQISQLAGSSGKRKTSGISPQAGEVQNKRRRTERYNLRRSNSVILVGETPCCQCPEQREKFTKLGLNSALFLEGSQRPKRKQSHISIITISSDDGEISAERTSEWVNSLDENQQSIEERDEESENHDNDASTTGEPVDSAGMLLNPAAHEQTFQPLCSSTLNISASLHSTVEDQVDESNTAKESDAPTATVTATRELGNFNYPKTPFDNFCLPSSSDTITSNICTPLRQEQSIQLLTNPPNLPSFSTIQFPSECPTEKPIKPTEYNYFTFSTVSQSDQTSLINIERVDLDNFKAAEEGAENIPKYFFGSSTESRNASFTAVTPFESCFSKFTNKSAYSVPTFSTTTENKVEDTCVPDQLKATEENSMIGTNNLQESNSQNSNNTGNAGDIL